MNNTQAAIVESSGAPLELSVVDVRKQVDKIQDLMKSVMKDGEHYGIIPGTKKPSLLKAGAEKLCFTFRLAPEFKITEKDLGEGHREYIVECTLRTMTSGTVVATGVGSCSTMEKKYRYRNINGKQVDNPDIADVYNTVLKMAKKRAHVDATITACAASDIFTQDVEDFADQIEPEPKEQRPARKDDGGTGKQIIDEIAEIMKSVGPDGAPVFSEADKETVRGKLRGVPLTDIDYLRGLRDTWKGVLARKLKEKAEIDKAADTAFIQQYIF